MRGIQAEFKTLRKLVRARIHRTAVVVPLEVFSNVEFLHIDWIRSIHHEAYVPEFQILTHIEFGYLDLERACERLKLLKVLEQCPKIEIAVIDQELCADDEGAEDWSYPQSVPGCISLQLKTCRLTNYVGSNDEFQFARNIMQNASNLQTMTICTNTSSNEAEKRKMIEIISLCTRDSATCKLSFE